MRVVVIDDEKDIASMLKSCLELEYKAEVYVANLASDGLNLIHTYKPDFVITDITMPGMSGLEMIRELRAENSSIPVILISAYTDPEHTVEALRLGAADFISKPFTMNELQLSIERILRMEHEDGILSLPLVQSGQFKWEFATGDFDIAGFSNLLATLVTRGALIPLNERNTFYVVIFEALTNAREHGNLGLRSHIKGEDMVEYQELLTKRLQIEKFAKRKVVIDFEYDDSQLIVCINDEGNGFDHALVDSSAFYSRDHLMKLHGKGLLIIKAYMDKVSFNDRGNQIRLIKRLSRQGMRIPK